MCLCGKVISSWFFKVNPSSDYCIMCQQLVNWFEPESQVFSAGCAVTSWCSLIIFIFFYFSSLSSEAVLCVDWCNTGNVCNLCSCLEMCVALRVQDKCSHLDSKVYHITSYYLVYMQCVLKKVWINIFFVLLSHVTNFTFVSELKVFCRSVVVLPGLFTSTSSVPPNPPSSPF